MEKQTGGNTRQRIRAAWLLAQDDPAPEFAQRETPVYSARSVVTVVQDPANKSVTCFKPCIERRQAAAEPQNNGRYEVVLYRTFEFEDGTVDSRAETVLQNLNSAPLDPGSRLSPG
jgi:hypothetical protein